MTAYDPRHNVQSSTAASVRSSVRRLSDSALAAIYAETRGTDATIPPRRVMEERVYRRALSSSRVRRSVEATRKADRERKRRERGSGLVL